MKARNAVVGISLSSYTLPAAPTLAGATVAQVFVRQSSGTTFTGNLSAGGADGAKFRIVKDSSGRYWLQAVTTVTADVSITITAQQRFISTFTTMPITISYPGLVPAPPPSVIPQTFAALGLDNLAFTPNGSTAVDVGNVVATMSPASPPSTGTITIGGADAASFQLTNGGVLPCKVQAKSTTGVGTYSITLTDTQPGIPNSPFTSGTLTIVGATFTSLGTHTFANFSGSTQANAVYKSTESFSPGVINPATEHFVLQTSAGAAMTYQYDEVSLWPGTYVAGVSGGIRNLLHTSFAPSVTAGGNHQLKIGKAAGAYSPSSTHVIGDLTSNSQIQVKYKDVINGATLAAIGSGNFTFDVNTAIGAGQYQITSNGPCRMAVFVYGKMTDDVGGAAYDNAFFECSIDVLYNPSSPTTVLSINFRPEASNPFVDSATSSLVPLSGYFTVVNVSGLSPTGTLRDFSADQYTFDQTKVNTGTWNAVYDNGPGGFHIAGNDMQTGECYKFTTGGTPPGGVTNGNRYFFFRWGDDTDFPTRQDYVYPSTDPFQNSNGNNAGTLPISSIGSGTFTLSRYQVLFSYQSIFLCAKTPASGNSFNDQGDRFWLGDTGSQLLYRNLDGTTHGSTEKARIQSTGLVAGWDLVNTPVAFLVNSSSTSAGPHYRPGASGTLRINFNTGGSSSNVGPYTEWDARTFCREGASGRAITDLDIQRRNELACAHLPFSKELRGRTSLPMQPRIVPSDNGTDNAGAVYPTLGTPAPTTFIGSPGGTWTWTAATTPTPNNIPAYWDNGSAFGSGNIQRSHWTYGGYFYYLATGDEDFLRIAYGSAASAVICAGQPGNPSEGQTRDIQYAGATHYYGKMLIFSEQRDAQALIAVARGCALGDETRPEKAYFKNIIDQNLNYFNYYYNTWKDPSIQNAAWVVGDIFATPLFLFYLIYTLCQVKNLTRHSLAGVALDAHTRTLAMLWDGSVTSPFFGPTFYFQTSSMTAQLQSFDVQANWPNAHGSATYPSLSQIFAGNVGQIIVDASTDTANYSTPPASLDIIINSEGQGWAPANGDKFIYDLFDGGTLPPELSAGTEYFMINVNTTAKTFQPSSDGVNPISFAGTSTYTFFVAIRSAGPSTSSVHNASDQISGTGYHIGGLGALREASRSGSSATGLSTAITNASSRWRTSIAAVAATSGGSDSAGDPGFRLCTTTAVPVI